MLRPPIGVPQGQPGLEAKLSLQGARREPGQGCAPRGGAWRGRMGSRSHAPTWRGLVSSAGEALARNWAAWCPTPVLENLSLPWSLSHVSSLPAPCASPVHRLSAWIRAASAPALGCSLPLRSEKGVVVSCEEGGAGRPREEAASNSAPPGWSPTSASFAPIILHDSTKAVLHRIDKEA